MEKVKELRIIIAGGRDFDDYWLLFNEVSDLLSELDDKTIVDSPNNVKFISGTCKGADVLGEQFAYKYDYEVVRFPADWDKYGKSAGYKRNCEMAKYASEAKTAVLIAFWDGESKGTRNMIDIAKRYGLDVRIVNY